MPEAVAQNFKNHAVFPKKTFVGFLLALAGIVSTVAGLFQVATTAGACLIGTGTLLVGMSTLWAGFVARTYALKIQDRVIRLEMRLRLEKILPPRNAGRYPQTHHPAANWVAFRLGCRDARLGWQGFWPKASKIPNRLSNWSATGRPTTPAPESRR